MAFTKPLLPWKSKNNYIFVCGGGGRGGMSAQAWAYDCAHVVLLIQYATGRRHLSSAVPLAPSFFDIN
jgi:hypothetical protein